MNAAVRSVICFYMWMCFIPIVKAQTTIIATEVGYGVKGNTGNGGLALNAKIDSVFGMAIDKHGNLYISEPDPFNVVRKINPQGIISVYAGLGGSSGTPYSGNGGPATAAHLNEPIGLACDTFGNLYIADNGNNVIRKVDTNGIITTVAGNNVPGYYAVNGPATSVGITVSNVTFDKYGNMYITGDHLVFKVDTSGYLKTIAGNSITSNSGVLGNEGPATNASFGHIVGITVDNYGNIFIADPGQQFPGDPTSFVNVIRKIDTSGIIHAFAGTPGAQSYGGDGGPATACQFNFIWPVGIAADLAGNIYVADQKNQRIRKISVVTGYINTIAGTGTYVSPATAPQGDHGPPTAAHLHGPNNVTFNQYGNLFISDFNNFRIREILPQDTLIISSDHGGYNLYDTICAGKTITFTAHIINGGYGDTVSWYKNGVKVGGNLLVFSTSTYNNNDSFTCKLYAPGGATVAVNAINQIKMVVNTATTSISGFPIICQGTSTHLTDGSPGGFWISNDTSIAIVDTNGYVYGKISGIDTIQYSHGVAACNSFIAITVNPSPSPIIAPPAACIGISSTLSDTVLGGTWSSSNPSRATISTSGVITAIAPPASLTITYSLPNGCIKVKPLNTAFPPAAITGTNIVCMNNTITLADATSGGVWNTTNNYLATAATGGIITGLHAGVDTIIYNHLGCSALKTITINLGPNAISGNLSMCVNSETQLTDSIPSGTWAISSSTIASINDTGGVISNSIGTTNVSYTLSNGCNTISLLSVNPLPYSIDGPISVCVGSTITLHDSLMGGTWSNHNPAIDSINSISGILIGLSSGVDTITYSSSSGCLSTIVITINQSPKPISNIYSGLTTICRFSSKFLLDSVVGGTWLSQNPTILSISDSGYITGLVNDTTHVTYTLPDGCSTTLEIIVDSIPTPIIGPSSVCTGVPVTLTNIGGGGRWKDTYPIEAIDSISGVLTELTPGIDTITYTLANHCFTKITVTVNTSPTPITGIQSICAGQITTLIETTSTGTWSLSDTIHASISNLGIITGVSADSLTVYYTLPTNCFVQIPFVIHSLPTSILGYSNVCNRALDTLKDTTIGGFWYSESLNVSIDSFTGIYHAISSGIDTIVYQLPTGCNTNFILSINPSPSPIIGSNSVCTGFSTLLSDSVLGGTWLLSDTTHASITSSGLIYGLSTDTLIVSYQFSNGCKAQLSFTVNISPNEILGNNILCTGNVVPYTDSVVGGSWHSKNSIATINLSSGILTALNAGMDTLIYTLSNSCTINKIITINQSPANIIGARNLCTGDTLRLTDITSFGIWSCNYDTVATISSSGFVNSLSAGQFIISYTLPNGCYKTVSIIVNTQPSAIIGTSTVCVNSTDSLIDTTLSNLGEWISIDTNIYIDVLGNVTGLVGGIDTIKYVLPSGCFTNKIITVEALPLSIVGDSIFCQGLQVNYSDTTTGGIWLSSNNQILTIGDTGLAVGVGSGVDSILYQLPTTGCTQILQVTINPSPAAISGINSLCFGNSTTLIDISLGGFWATNDSSIATIDTNGLITGISVGNTSITYALDSFSGCYTTFPLTISPIPSIINGIDTICSGFITYFKDSNSNGYWHTPSSGIMIDSITGKLTAIDSGINTLIYSLYTGCSTQKNILVNQSPSIIYGDSEVCVGNSIQLTDNIANGTWISMEPNIITNNGSYLTGLKPGVSTIKYTLLNGCFVAKPVTVNSSAGNITGNTSINLGKSTTLSSPIAGGSWVSSNLQVASISETGIVNSFSVGTDEIYYILANGCKTSTIVTVNVGVDEGYIKIVPNPAISSFDILYNLPENSYFIISDGLGKKMFSILLFSVNNQITVPCSYLANGIYNYRVIHDNKVLTEGKIEKL